MALHKETKADILKKYRLSELDTGSPEVQIALLTARITHLTDHFKKHKHDHHGRRGLLRLVNQRRSMLDYLKRKKFERYQNIIKDLGIRK